MKKTVYKIILIVVLLVVAAAMAGCFNSREEMSTGVPEAVVDSTGTEILLDSVPQRIISLMPSKTEKLFALGLGDRVVGVTDMCDYPPELEDKEITRVGDASSLSMEVIVSLEPDLVVATWLPEGMYEQLGDLDISVFLYSPSNIEETIKSIEMLGKLTGSQQKATQVISQMTEEIDAVKAQAAQIKEKKKVLCLLDENLFVAGKGTLQDELITLAGGINLVEEEGWPQLSEEVLLDLNPDVILYTFPGGEALFQREALQGLKCVQEGRVYKLDESLSSRPGPRLSKGLKQILYLLYPEE